MSYKLPEMGTHRQNCIICKLPAQEFLEFNYGIVFVHEWCKKLAHENNDGKYIVLIDFVEQYCRAGKIET